MMKSIKDIPWECGRGWWPMIERIASAIDSFNAAHPDSPVEVSQIKQKFGGLRIYHYNAPEDIRQLIDRVNEASWHTCERCGSTEGVTTNMEGYRLTLCPDCRSKVTPRTIVKQKNTYVAMKKIMSTSMSSAKKVYLDYSIPKNSGSRPSDFFNEQVRAGHPCELFIKDDGSYICRVYA